MDAEKFTVIARTDISSLKTEITTGKHIFYADEPVEDGGGDAGPSPYDILISALGACTGMTLTLYARRKEMPLKTVTVYLHHNKVYAEDCTTCEQATSKLDTIHREIELTGDLSADQRTRLLYIADQCPVHKTLTKGLTVSTRLI